MCVCVCVCVCVCARVLVQECWCLCALVNPSQDGHAALLCAIENGHANCARLLLEAGADMEAKDNVRA